MAQSDFDIMDGLGELQESEAVKTGAKDIYGIFGLRYRRYKKKARTTQGKRADGSDGTIVVEVSKAEYEAALKSGKTAKDFGGEYVISVGAAEFGSKFDYERGVNTQGPDMKCTLIPSVRLLAGLSAPKADKDGNIPASDMDKVLLWLYARVGQPVHIEDMPTVNYSGEPDDSGYHSPRIVEFYADRAACQAAHTARWGKKDDSTNGAQSSIIYPPAGTFTRSQWDEQIPLIKRLLVEGGYTPEQIAGDPNVQIPNAKTRLKLRAEVWGFGVPVECIASLIDEAIPA